LAWRAVPSLSRETRSIAILFGRKESARVRKKYPGVWLLSYHLLYRVIPKWAKQEPDARALGELQEEGAVELRRRRIHVRDPKELRCIADRER
jgi:hypothetical protein